MATDPDTSPRLPALFGNGIVHPQFLRPEGTGLLGKPTLYVLLPNTSTSNVPDCLPPLGVGREGGGCCLSTNRFITPVARSPLKLRRVRLATLAASRSSIATFSHTLTRLNAEIGSPNR